MQQSGNEALLINSVSPESSNASTKTTFQEKNRLRLQCLFAIVFAQLILLIWLLPKDPLIAWRFNRILHPAVSAPAPDYTEALQKDPVPGSFSLMSTGEKIPLSAVKKSQTGYFVVSVGDCAGCIAVDLKQWQRDAETHKLPMILFTSASKKQADHFTHQLGLSVPVIVDTKGVLLSPLNAVWPGRAYLFSSDWRLLWIQREPMPTYNPFKDDRFLQALQGASQ